MATTRRLKCRLVALYCIRNNYFLRDFYSVRTCNFNEGKHGQNKLFICRPSPVLIRVFRTALGRGKCKQPRPGRGNPYAARATLKLVYIIRTGVVEGRAFVEFVLISCFIIHLKLSTSPSAVDEEPMGSIYQAASKAQRRAVRPPRKGFGGSARCRACLVISSVALHLCGII